MKPFDWEELLARLRSLLRRADAATPDKLRYGELSLSLSSGTVIRGEREIELTKTDPTRER